MHIHFLGICGTFMGSLAVIAKQMGYQVTGSDKNVYPPMSTQLESQGIDLIEGYGLEQLDPLPDCVVIGNAMSRGNPVVEAILNRNIPYTSGPEWLARHVLSRRWVIAVAGTHGKTTTTSMLAWILEYAGFKPGILVGGVPKNFGISARLGESDFFVIEADEYDTAFFDKRSKFVHYHPKTTILNNLEFDHADIFENLAAIQKQFHHLVRIVPEVGCIICPNDEVNLNEVLEKGCWSPKWSFALNDGAKELEKDVPWVARKVASDASEFTVIENADNDAGPQEVGTVSWALTGDHNVKNAMAALLAARHCGIDMEEGIAALNLFENVKRRMDKVGEVNGVTVYDDFAHHPTAIASTLAGMRNRIDAKSDAAGSQRLIAIIEPRSNTMKMGVHQFTLVASAEAADLVLWLNPESMKWKLDEQTNSAANQQNVFQTTNEILAVLADELRSGDHVVVMSNGSFDNIHQRILELLERN